LLPNIDNSLTGRQNLTANTQFFFMIEPFSPGKNTCPSQATPKETFMNTIKPTLRTIFTFRWKPGKDLLAVLVSCLLVTASLYAATFIITPQAGGGIPYFLMYAGLTVLIRDGLQLPLLAAVGFLEVLVVMLVLVWLADRYYRMQNERREQVALAA
jgi:hypothetical protein